MAALLVGNPPLVEPLAVAVGDTARVRQEDPEPLLLGEDRGAVAADSAAQNDDEFLLHDSVLYFPAVPEAPCGPGGRPDRLSYLQRHQRYGRQQQ